MNGYIVTPRMFSSVADPDLEINLDKLGGGGSFDLLTLLAFLSSVISAFFTQNKLGTLHPPPPARAPPLDPPL